MNDLKKPEKIKLRVNRKDYTVTSHPDQPLLWVIRENLGLTGTKYGCGISLCGACTVLVGGEAVRSCVTPVGSVARKEIVTIEGLSPDGSHPLQKAWREYDVPQCGYCHSGQILSAAALLAKDGVHAAVVSMPSFELFREQPGAYQDSVLGHGPRVGSHVVQHKR